MLGRRITGIALNRRKPGVEKVVNNRIYFLFDDGTGFEMFCTGEIFPCQQIDAFDLYTLTQRGSTSAACPAIRLEVLCAGDCDTNYCCYVCFVIMYWLKN